MQSITLVTGGTGFIGSHLVTALVRRGRSVRCLVRRTSDTSYLRGLGVQLAWGDLLDSLSLRRAVKDADTVYHLAALVRPNRVFSPLGALKQAYACTNIQGTANLAAVSCEEGVSRFIYYSSIAAAGPLIDSPAQECLPMTEYGRSKLAAETDLLRLVREKNFPALVIRPGQIYGPRCVALRMLFRLIARGLFIGIGDGSNRIPVCYVDDLINATLRAEEIGKIGKIYCVAAQLCAFREYAGAIAEAVGGRIYKSHIPLRLAFRTACLKEFFERSLRFKLCPFRMDLGSEGIASFVASYNRNADRCRDELGYNAQVGLNTGMAFTAQWFRARGML